MLGRQVIYNTKEAAKLLGISYSTLRRVFKDGKIEGRVTQRGKLRCIKFSKQDIENYKKQQLIDYSQETASQNRRHGVQT
ncbi:MAG: Helix-turn-helix domain protein [Candidatus Scalindua rubra]|uniref:Helix-turn-helix domain protein n=1 Tax=Candidatus Scalindua rubra TaxID=1872076 RepID=A0A1E3XDK1_9BACT|nr:MAG: Helix-turn-helix domain protein [Candidatus Scalindua rubra]